MNFRNYYRRPRETHRCGLSAAGRACTHGPMGDRCGQSRDISERCTPIRTLLGWSRLVSSMCTILAILAVSYWFLSPKNNLALAPGELSNAHAQLLVSGRSDHPLSIDNEKRCAACHPNAISKPSLKLASMDSGHSIPVQLASVRKQSELCMNCHYDTMPNGLLGNPHDLVGDELIALLASVSDRHPRKLASEPTECSQCHREHQGSDGDLQAITSAKCQACHRKQFQSFSQGHPEFESYPPNKPRSIGFDHARHAELHFAKKGRSFQCDACHVQAQQSGLVGSVFRSVSFEQSCADCHNDSLKSSGIEGLVVFQIPSVDRAKLSRNGHDIGPWPESASLMMDGELTPLLTHMLRSSDSGRGILSQLPKSGRLKDVNLDDPQQSRAIADLTRFVRERWVELANDGQPLLKQWMGMSSTSNPGSVTTNVAPGLDLYARFVSARSSSDPAATTTTTRAGEKNRLQDVWANQLATGIPPDLLRSASQKWFRPESKSPVAAMPSTNNERLPVVMNLIPARMDQGDRITQPKSPQSTRGERQQSTPLISSTSLRFEPIMTLNSNQDDDDLLAGQGDDLLASPKGSSDSLQNQDDILTSSDDLLLGTDPNALAEQQSNINNASESGKPLKPWEHLPYGGWMIDDNRVALVYVPVGHADPWVSRWIEWNLLVQSELGVPDFQDPFLKQCIQCHSFDRQRVQQMLSHVQISTGRNVQENGVRAVNGSSRQDLDDFCWKIEQRPNALRELTKFNHTPHLSINSLRDCQTCHKLKKLNDQNLTEQGWSDRGRTIRSEFVPVEKNQCASCHTTQSAGDACTQCHNYHVHGLFQEH